MHPGALKAAAPLIVGGALLIYRRISTSVGRQSFRPAQLWLRAVLFLLVAGVASVSSLSDVVKLGSVLAGLAAGCGLGIYAANKAEPEMTAEGSFYKPHLYIGLLVTALFLARIAYRAASLYGAGAHGAPPAALETLSGSPLTLGLFCLTAGYYAANAGWLLVRFQRLGRNRPAWPSDRQLGAN